MYRYAESITNQSPMGLHLLYTPVFALLKRDARPNASSFRRAPARSFRSSYTMRAWSALTTFAADCGVVGSGKGKLGAGDIGLIFEQVKLGKRTELDFERFQEAVRKIAVGTG